MRDIHLTVIFTGQVPDDTNIEALCLNLDLGQVQMVYCHDPELLDPRPFAPMKNPVKGKLLGYETIDVEVLDDDSRCSKCSKLYDEVDIEGGRCCGCMTRLPGRG